MAKERLDVILVSRGLVDSRASAAARVLAGEVVVTDHRVDKPGTKVDVDSEIRLKGDGNPYVSRGGLKLEGGVDAFAVDVADKIAVDVGASTGGFTNVPLERGAKSVYAVDVGWGQLHERLRTDPRVKNLERTHIAKLEVGALDPAPSVGVIDVSFISLRQVLPALLPHLARPAVVIALIKPQFEVGREAVGKGGIVRDDAAHAAAVSAVVDAAVAVGYEHHRTIPSPITGTDGNVEYLAHFSVPLA